MAATPAVQASRRLGAEVKALGFTIVNVTEIEGCTTIDAGPDPALDCARQGNPGAAPGHSTAEAVHGLPNCLGPSRRRASMVGHGTEGIITTGAGQSGNDSNSYIGLLNQPDWQPHVSRLNALVDRLSLWACYAGAGEKGAQFLHNVARVVDGAVAGPNGLVCCENGTLYLETDSTWQVATPSHRPRPIPIAAVGVAEVVSRMTLREGEGWAMVSVGQVAALRYERLSREPNHDLAPVELTGREAQRLVGMVDFS